MAWGSTTAEAWSATDLDSWSSMTRRGIQATDELLDELGLDKSLAHAKENGRQEGNLNVGYHCSTEELNQLHPFWKMTGEETPKDNAATISFNAITFTRTETDKDLRENTDFLERGERPLCEVAKIVEASIGKKPIWPIIAHINDKFKVNAMDIIIEEILETLEAGKNYHFNNCSSLRLRSSPGSINSIKSSYVLFRYIVGLPPLTFPPPPKPLTSEEKRLKLAEAKQELLQLQIQAQLKSGNFQSGECKITPKLVRQASRSAFCSPK